jgi:hypothetical protein
MLITNFQQRESVGKYNPKSFGNRGIDSAEVGSLIAHFSLGQKQES